MQHTTNLNLNKPELTDAPPDITVLNENWDALDTEINDLQENKADKELTANKELTNVTNSDFRAKAQAAGVAIEVNEISANHILSLANAGDLLKCTNTSAITITVPANDSVPFPIGTEIEIIRDGAENVAIDAVAGVTIKNFNNIAPPDLSTILNYKTNDRILPTQFAGVTLKKIGANDWFLSGDIYKIKPLIATITSSQDWTVPAGVTEVEVYLVGGGGGGFGEKGGGGGYCKLFGGIKVTPGTSVPIIIGGGGVDGNGGYSQFISSTYRVNGGIQAVSSAGGNGGSGGGGSGNDVGGDGGSNGSDGYAGTGSTYTIGGIGGGTVNYDPLNPYNNTHYGGGGGGGGGTAGGTGGDGGGGHGGAGAANGSNGTANTGGGGGGRGMWGGQNHGKGGSGICLIYG